MELYTAPPPGSTVICADELGPVIPRTLPPAPGWSPDGHRIKAPLEYSRGPEKTWVYGGLRVADGQAVTMCAPSRNSAFYQDFLQLAEQANPEGMIYVITGNLSSHDSKATRAWLEDHPRIRHAFIVHPSHPLRLDAWLPRTGLPPAGDDELTNMKKHHGITPRCHLPFCWAHEKTSLLDRCRP